MPDALHSTIPTLIQTPRLRLRPFRAADASEFHAALIESMDDLRRYLWFLSWVAEEPTLASAEARCRTAEDNFLLRTELPFLAHDAASGRLVGSIGLYRTDWSMPKTEVGFWIRSSETGKGYAREGVAALTSWALDGLGAKRVELVADERNLGSRAVAERCGYRLEGILHNVQEAPDGSLRNSCIYARVPGPG